MKLKTKKVQSLYKRDDNNEQSKAEFKSKRVSLSDHSQNNIITKSKCAANLKGFSSSFQEDICDKIQNDKILQTQTAFFSELLQKQIQQKYDYQGSYLRNQMKQKPSYIQSKSMDINSIPNLCYLNKKDMNTNYCSKNKLQSYSDNKNEKMRRINYHNTNQPFQSKCLILASGNDYVHNQTQDQFRTLETTKCIIKTKNEKNNQLANHSLKTRLSSTYTFENQKLTQPNNQQYIKNEDDQIRCLAYSDVIAKQNINSNLIDSNGIRLNAFNKQNNRPNSFVPIKQLSNSPERGNAFPDQQQTKKICTESNPSNQLETNLQGTMKSSDYNIEKSRSSLRHLTKKELSLRQGNSRVISVDNNKGDTIDMKYKVKMRNQMYRNSNRKNSLNENIIQVDKYNHRGFTASTDGGRSAMIIKISKNKLKTISTRYDNDDNTPQTQTIINNSMLRTIQTNSSRRNIITSWQKQIDPIKNKKMTSSNMFSTIQITKKDNNTMNFQKGHIQNSNEDVQRGRIIKQILQIDSRETNPLFQVTGKHIEQQIEKGQGEEEEPLEYNAHFLLASKRQEYVKKNNLQHTSQSQRMLRGLVKNKNIPCLNVLLQSLRNNKSLRKHLTHPQHTNTFIPTLFNLFLQLDNHQEVKLIQPLTHFLLALLPHVYYLFPQLYIYSTFLLQLCPKGYENKQIRNVILFIQQKVNVKNIQFLK